MLFYIQIAFSLFSCRRGVPHRTADRPTRQWSRAVLHMRLLLPVLFPCRGTLPTPTKRPPSVAGAAGEHLSIFRHRSTPSHPASLQYTNDNNNPRTTSCQLFILFLICPSTTKWPRGNNNTTSRGSARGGRRERGGGATTA